MLFLKPSTPWQCVMASDSILLSNDLVFTDLSIVLYSKRTCFNLD